MAGLIFKWHICIIKYKRDYLRNVCIKENVVYQLVVYCHEVLLQPSHIYNCAIIDFITVTCLILLDCRQFLSIISLIVRKLLYICLGTCRLIGGMKHFDCVTTITNVWPAKIKCLGNTAAYQISISKHQYIYKYRQKLMVFFRKHHL